MNTEHIDLESYAMADVMVIDLATAAGGDADLLAALKGDLEGERDRGWCVILHMDDTIAVVRWQDKFVLTITDKGLAMTFAVGGDQ